ncbi:MAG TPA: subclass B3 metallo-beta-lactamase [Puia sp.]
MQHLKHTITAFLLTTILASTQLSAQKLYAPLSNPDWTKERQPFRIAGNLYYVGTFDLGIYLITTPKGHILINTGVPGSETAIRKHIEALGFKVSDIKILLTTQAHFDHVGAMAAMKRITGAQLMVHERDAPLLADGGNSDFDMGGKGPMFQPVKVDRLLHNGETVSLGNMQITVLHHPGHTKGSCSYLFTVKDEKRSYRVLIANMPSILDDTKFPGMPTYPEVGKDYAHTLDTMPKVQFDLFLASHAGQFDLDKKYKPGSGYHPEVFMDRPGYLAAIEDLHKAYLKRIGK